MGNMGLLSCGEEVPNHIALKHTDKIVRRYQFIPEGGMLPPPEELPPEIRRNKFGNNYKRLHRLRPSLTIVPGNNALPIHPILDRSLTPREAARLQSFPDTHTFCGDRRTQCILAGNAVPPLLGLELAKSVKSRFFPYKGAAANITRIEVIASKQSRPLAIPKPPSEVKKSNGTARTFIDLFCGAGGFSIGFRNAGLTPLLAVVFNDRVAEAHSINFPSIPFIHGDIRDPLVQQKIAEPCDGDTFAVVGGPPCQGFSVFRRRRLAKVDERTAASDPRNRLVLAFVDTVARIMPRWFVMENVSGFASMRDGAFVEVVQLELRRLGYTNIEYRVLNAADYGVPQHRKHFILIANRTGHVIPWPKKKFFEIQKDWQLPFATVGEYITDLSTDESLSAYKNHIPMNHRPLQVERYRCIPKGGRLDVESLPDELKKGYRTETVNNFSHVFRRLHREKPSLTLVPGHNAYPLHPWLDRSFTVREAARLQTFPDEIEFIGARQDQCIQVGNAFPPRLAELIANNLVRAETSKWFPGKVPTLARKSLLELDET